MAPEGLEPSRPNGQRILSAVCLPVPARGHRDVSSRQVPTGNTNQTWIPAMETATRPGRRWRSGQASAARSLPRDRPPSACRTALKPTHRPDEIVTAHGHAQNAALESPAKRAVKPARQRPSDAVSPGAQAARVSVVYDEGTKPHRAYDRRKDGARKHRAGRGGSPPGRPGASRRRRTRPADVAPSYPRVRSS